MWLCEVTRRPVEVDTCLECALHHRAPSCPLDYLVLRKLAREIRDDEGVELLRATGFPVVRVTSLIGCPRAAWYELHNVQPDPEPPSRLWARLRGTIFHEALLPRDGALTERRLAVFVKGVAFVTGRVDWYDPTSETLVDIKTVSRRARWDRANGGFKEFEIKANPRHVQQLRLYKWLLEENGYPVTSARLLYLSMQQTKSIPVELTLDGVEEFVLDTLSRITAETPPPPVPPEGEGWRCSYCPYGDCPSNANSSIRRPREELADPFAELF